MQTMGPTAVLVKIDPYFAEVQHCSGQWQQLLCAFQACLMLVLGICKLVVELLIQVAHLCQRGWV